MPEPKICKIHKEPLVKKSIKVLFGLPAFDIFYEEDKKNNFPNCGDPTLGGCCVSPGHHPSTTKWICPVCKKKRAKWLKTRKENTN